MTIFDPAALATRLDELNEQLSAPGFWDNPKAAAVVSAEHAFGIDLEDAARANARAADRHYFHRAALAVSRVFVITALPP